MLELVCVYYIDNFFMGWGLCCFWYYFIVIKMVLEDCRGRGVWIFKGYNINMWNFDYLVVGLFFEDIGL